MDVSREETAFCVKDKDGKVLASGKVATDPDALFAVRGEPCPCPARVVMETGTLSGWLARESRKRAPPVAADRRPPGARGDAASAQQDGCEAELPAEIGRAGFRRPVAVKSETAREGRILLKARAHLVRRRRDTENTIRGLLASLGMRFPKGAGKLAGRVHEALAERPELKPAIEPPLSAVAALKGEIERLDKAVMARAKDDPACRVPVSAPGIGPVTALAYVATIGDAERFAKSRAVGAYVGLTSRRWRSGGMDYSGRISKHGDAMPRALLFEAANSLPAVVRRAHPLKDWARRVRKRTSHKKACVALARKLAVIPHRMPVTGELFRWPEKQATTTA